MGLGAVLLLLIWRVQRAELNDGESARAVVSEKDATVETLSPPDRSRASPPPTASRSEPGTAELMRPPPLELRTGTLPWERQIADTIARFGTPAEKASALLKLLPTFPPEAHAAATEKALEHLPDRDYAAVALPAVTNPATAGQAMSVLFADLMERPDAITLPALLSIAQNPRHPFAAPALDNLRLLLRTDFGNDWTKWAAAVDQRLRR